MRSRLYVRTALSVAAACAIGAVATGWLLHRNEGRFRRMMARGVTGSGLQWVQAELAEMEPAARSARLDKMQPHFRFPLWLVTRDQLPEPPRLDPTRRSDPEETIVFDEALDTVYLPIDEHECLAAGPLRPGPPPRGLNRGPPPRTPPRPPRRFVGPMLTAVLVVLFSTVLVAIPLTRRLRELEIGIRRLARGDLSARVDEAPSHELGHLAASINEMATHLQTLFRQRDELLQAISHEIGTPLARMRFHLERAGRKRIDGVDPELEALEAELVELDELSSELVRWVEADAGPMEKQPVDPIEMVSTIVEIEDGYAEDIDISCDIDPLVSEPLRIQAEPRQFGRAIENLVRNAVQHGRTTVVVGISVAEIQGAEAVLIRVSDDGLGIPIDRRQDIFQPFVQGSKVGTAGLGLAIARRIVERHHGTIEATESELGGARLETVWPLLPAA